jgi:hypothetical protein
MEDSRDGRAKVAHDRITMGIYVEVGGGKVGNYSTCSSMASRPVLAEG